MPSKNKGKGDDAPMTMRLDDIKLGRRHRKDMGDIPALAASIAELGLLHPVVVDPFGSLIAGARRLKACQSLGWSDVPVTVIDMDEIIRGESAENSLRKDFTASEAVEIAAALRPLEEKAAKERQREAGGDTTAGGKLPQPDTGKTRDRVARAVGMSGRTLEKAEAVTAKAKAEPETFGPLLDLMDTKSVDAAHREMRKIEAAREQAESDAAAAGVMAADPAVRENVRKLEVKEQWSKWLDKAQKAIQAPPPVTVEEALGVFNASEAQYQVTILRMMARHVADLIAEFEAPAKIRMVQ